MLTKRVKLSEDESLVLYAIGMEGREINVLVDAMNEALKERNKGRIVKLGDILPSIETLGKMNLVYHDHGKLHVRWEYVVYCNDTKLYEVEIN